MARVRAPAFVSRLRDALQTELAALGMRAEVGYEPVSHTPFYRFIVVSKSFKNLWHSERDEIVRRIAESALSHEENMRISMILTLTPEEAGLDDRRQSRRANRSRKPRRKTAGLLRTGRG